MEVLPEILNPNEWIRLERFPRFFEWSTEEVGSRCADDHPLFTASALRVVRKRLWV